MGIFRVTVGVTSLINIGFSEIISTFGLNGLQPLIYTLTVLVVLTLSFPATVLFNVIRNRPSVGVSTGRYGIGTESVRVSIFSGDGRPRLGRFTVLNRTAVLNVPRSGTQQTCIKPRRTTCIAQQFNDIVE